MNKVKTVLPVQKKSKVKGNSLNLKNGLNIP